jgi:hypothetical protein
VGTTQKSDDFHFYTIEHPKVQASMIGVGAESKTKLTNNLRATIITLIASIKRQRMVAWQKVNLFFSLPVDWHIEFINRTRTSLLVRHFFANYFDKSMVD